MTFKKCLTNWKIIKSLLEQNGPRVLNHVTHTHQEGGSLATINKTVIICKCDIHHGSNNNLIITYNRSLVSRVHSEDSTLRGIDDWGTHHRSKDTTVGNRESTAYKRQLAQREFKILSHYKRIALKTRSVHNRRENSE